jgi:MFS family permease
MHPGSALSRSSHFRLGPHRPLVHTAVVNVDVPAPRRGTDRAPLFTPHFFAMCAFNFTIFISAFQLFPTAPYRILELGGGTAAAGFFLGFLTYASALSAPFTGALADRLGRTRMLVTCSSALTVFCLAYAASGRYQTLLWLVPIHGLFWSGLLSAGAAHMADQLPESRRAEGLGYWGSSTVLALAFAPTAGLWIHRHFGWRVLCLETAALNVGMGLAAWRLTRHVARPAHAGHRMAGSIEWRVIAVSITLFLYAFGYGAITSFSTLYADYLGITPRAVYFTVFSVTTLLVRTVSGRVAETVGYRRVFIPCLLLITTGYLLLALATGRAGFILSGVVFGIGFGAAWPVYMAHVLQYFDATRRGAVFGGVLSCFDTGIGTGSIASGWLVAHWGFRGAFLTAAGLAALALPYFLIVEPQLLGARGERNSLAPEGGEG